MKNIHPIPMFEEALPELNKFILEITEEYRAGELRSWDDLEFWVERFFIDDHLSAVEAIAPGWEKMASFSGGITQVHVMCVFLGLHLSSEYEQLTADQKQLAKWIVLFHDVAKEHVRGKRDYKHGFISAALAAQALPALGFSHAVDFDKKLGPWKTLTCNSIKLPNGASDLIQDNSKLPEIMQGIDELFGKNSPAALITQGVLLHMSINVVDEFPQAAPLSDEEIKRFVSPELLPLLKAMMLADNDGWTLFIPDVCATQRRETLRAFEAVEKLIKA
jgi:hypothetical protein